MDQQEINVSKPPCFVLGTCHCKRVLFPVVVVPQLRRNEDFLSFYETFADSPTNALTGFLFVLIIICAIEEAIPSLDSLEKHLSANNNFT